MEDLEAAPFHDGSIGSVPPPVQVATPPRPSAEQQLRAAVAELKGLQQRKAQAMEKAQAALRDGDRTSAVTLLDEAELSTSQIGALGCCHELPTTINRSLLKPRSRMQLTDCCSFGVGWWVGQRLQGACDSSCPRMARCGAPWMWS